MATLEKDIQAFTTRIPTMLYIAAQSDVAKRKANGERKLSMQDWLLEAVRGKLYPESGPGRRDPVEISAAKISEKTESQDETSGQRRSVEIVTSNLLSASHPRLSAAELAAKFGTKTLATIEEVEPRFDPDSGYIPPSKTESIVVQEHMPSRNWVKFYADRREMEPAEAEYSTKGAMAGIKTPPGFRTWPENKQVAWLNFNA